MQAVPGSPFGLEPVSSWSMDGRQIRVKETKSVRRLDYPHSGGALLVDNLVAKGLHSRPVHLWPEMMFGVVTIVEPGPIVEFVISAHAPGNGLVGIAAVMSIIAVQVGETVPKIPKRKKETDVTPVEDPENDKGGNEQR